MKKQSKSNQEFYNKNIFDDWAYRDGLIPEERYLIETFLTDINSKTLEAGTGGGRILLEMQKVGYTSLSGFDYLPRFIEVAKTRDSTDSIKFEVQDATALSYADASFEYTIYLQQVICFIESEDARENALAEAYRILQPSGTALFSFLCYDTRIRNPLCAAFMTYLRLLRAIRGSSRSIHDLPWFKKGSKLRYASLLDRGPYVHWYSLDEIVAILQKVGYDIQACGSGMQVINGKLCTSPEDLARAPMRGFLYFVCRKQCSQSSVQKEHGV